MKKIAGPPPQCALNPPDATGNNSLLPQSKDDRGYLANRGSARNNSSPRFQGQLKREPQRMNHPWSNPTFENSNTSWEGDWSGTPPIKNDVNPGAFYKPGARNPASYQSGSEWSPGDSSASSSNYGMIQSNNSMGGSSYYENNNFYGGGYNNFGQVQPFPPSYGPQPQYQQPGRASDGYNGSRSPSSCPVGNKQPAADFQRRQNRYGAEAMPKGQIKQELDEYQEAEGENFTSLFTKSLTSLYSQDTENAFSEAADDSDIMIISPPPPTVPVAGNQAVYQQRAHSSGGQYSGSTSGEYQDGRNNFGFYENRIQNCDSSGSVVQEIGSKEDRMSSFRYDRPSFDDMHLYASNSADSKAQHKKRKVSMPTSPPENNFPENNRKKASRLMTYKSESQWTPNSFGFDGIQIKQEPMDDYSSNELDTQMSFKDNSPGSSGNGSGNSKTPEQPKDHPAKQPPRKRSPASTCFDRFDKKSTPTNKKVSPLSVYAKVQESVVLSVKCRRYKKRTKPITSKEEALCPGKEEMENYKRSSLTPDQAAKHVMSELLDRVSLNGDQSEVGGPDLSQMDPYKLQELVMQFCHRSNLDYRDFEDVSSILRPRILEDKMAKNSVRASAIRKRTSTSPVQPRVEPPPTEGDDSEPPPVAKTRRRRKRTTLEESSPSEKRILRQLPGRASRRNGDSGSPVVTRRYSTRNGKDAEEGNDSGVDVVIDLSTDREDEAGKEAEVRKKSQRLKNRHPVRDRSLEENKELVERTTSSERSSDKSKQLVGKRPAREKSLEKKKPVSKTRDKSSESVSKSVIPIKTEHFEESRRRTRSREKRVEVPKESPTPSPRRRRSCLRRMSSSDSVWRSSVEIVDITRSSDSASPPLLDAIKIEPPMSKSEEKTKTKNTKKGERSKSKDSNKKESVSALEFVDTSKTEDVIEIEPPVLRKSVGRTRTKDSIKIEPPSLSKSAETIKRRNSSKLESPSCEFVKKIKIKQEIKLEPSSLSETIQEMMSESTNSVSETEVTNSVGETEVIFSRKSVDNPLSPSSRKFLKDKIEETSPNSAVKSGSSKRKQGGPTKFLKENSKNATLSTFLESNSNSKNSVPDVIKEEQMGSKKFCNSNLLSKFSPSKLLNNISAIALPESDNSPQSLKERYRKSFCSESSTLHSSPPKLPKGSDEKPAKYNSLPKSNISTRLLKDSLLKSPVLDSKQSLSKDRSNSATKNRGNNSINGFSNFLNKTNSPLDVPFSFSVKVKEEPLSEEDIPNNFDYVDSSDKLETFPKANRDINTERKPVKVVRNMPIKKLARRRSSQCSESELQVVLTKLPDVHVNLRNGSVAVELVRKCEEEQERMDAVIKEQELSEYDSEEEKPLVSIKKANLRLFKMTRTSETNCVQKQNLPNSSAVSINPSNNLTSKTIPTENLKPTRAAIGRRYSESEDSDCGLVIDLDRRLSVEERVPSPMLHNSITDEEMTETESSEEPPIDPIPNVSTGTLPVFTSDKPTNSSFKPLITVPDDPSTTTSKEPSTTTSKEPLTTISKEPLTTTSKESLTTASKEPLTTITDEPPTAAAKDEPVPDESDDAGCTNLFRDATEEAHILLQLSRGGMPPMTEEATESPSGKWTPKTISSVETSGDELSQTPTEEQAVEMRAPERDESILRTLLLENGDAVPGMSQDTEPQPGPSTSSVEMKPAIQEAVRLLIYQVNSPSTSGLGGDEKKTLDQLQLDSDQLPTDCHSKILLESYEWCLRDPLAIRGEIKKLETEIRYKKVVLKMLLRKLDTIIKDQVPDCVEQKPEMKNPVNQHQTVVSTSSVNGVYPRLSVACATVKTESPRATATSSESYSSSSGENLPTVATMVANATENYGVDLRTVTNRKAVNSTKTILQEALSSKEPIYCPVASRSPLPPNERLGESLLAPPKPPMATREPPFFLNGSSPPTLPELSLKGSLPFSRRLLNSRTSQSPPALQTGSSQSSFTRVASNGLGQQHPVSLVVTSSETGTTKSSRVSSSASHTNGFQKHSSRSSPKSNSFNSSSVWCKLETERNSSPSDISVDLRTNHLPSNRPASINLANGHPSSFTIVPPPTTLQSSFKRRSHHNSKSEGPCREKAVNGKVERIFERGNDTMRWPEHSKTCSRTHLKENSKSYN